MAAGGIYCIFFLSYLEFYLAEFSQVFQIFFPQLLLLDVLLLAFYLYVVPVASSGVLAEGGL